MHSHKGCKAAISGFLTFVLALSLMPAAAFGASNTETSGENDSGTETVDRETVTAEAVDTGEVTLYQKYVDDEFDDNLDDLTRYTGYNADPDQSLVANDDGHTYYMPVELALFTDDDGTLYYFLTRGDRKNAMECILIDASAALGDNDWVHTDQTVELNIPGHVEFKGEVYDVISIGAYAATSTYSYYKGLSPYDHSEINNTGDAKYCPYSYYTKAVENKTAFYNANNWNNNFTDGVYDFGKALTSGTSMKNIMAEVRNDGGYAECQMVAGLHIPATVETVGEAAFCGFHNLQSVTFGEGSQLREIEAEGFYSMNNASACVINLPEGLTTLGSKTYLTKGGTYNDTGETGKYVDEAGDFCSIENRVIDTTIYNHYAEMSSYGMVFYSCTAEIHLSSVLEFVTDAGFYGSGIVSLDISSPDLIQAIETYSFDTIIGAQNTMSRLESVDIAENEYGFYTCEDVLYQDSGDQTQIICFPSGKTVWTELPASITEVALTYTSSFKNTSLQKVVLPDTVKSIGSKGFYYCTALEEVTIPESVVEFGSYAFSYCSMLEELTIPSSVAKIGDYAFQGCSLLANIELPETLTELGSYCFDATAITYLAIPASVGATINSIGSNNIPNLKRIDIFYGQDSSTDTLTFEKYGFAECPKLEEVNIYGDLSKIVFDETLDRTSSNGKKYGSYQFTDLTNFSINLLGQVGSLNFAPEGENKDAILGWAQGGTSVTSEAEMLTIRSWQEGLESLVGEENATAYFETDKVAYEQLESVDDWSASIGETSYTYAGTEITPNVSVTNSAGAVASSDFTISCKNNVNVGTATASVIGAGKYRAFEQDLEFTIDPANLADASVRGTDATYMGDAVTPDAIEATWNGMELAEGTDFEIVGYANNVKPGKAKVTVEGENNFTGEATGSFYIVVSDEDQAAVTAVEDAIAALSAEPTEEEVAVAQDAYDALSAAQKALVANAATLMDAQQYVLDQKIAAAQKAAEEAQQAADEAEQKANEAEEAAKQAEEAEQTAKDAQAAAEQKAAEAEEAEQAAKDAQAAAEQKAAEAEQAYQDLLKNSGTESTELSNAKKQISELQNELASTKTQTVTSVTVNDKNVTAKTVASAISKAGGDPKYVVSITLGKKVKKIGKKAFAKCSKTTNLTVTSTKLAKKTVKKSLKGSKISVVQVKGKAKTAKKYAKIFTKKNAGKAVAVVKA